MRQNISEISVCRICNKTIDLSSTGREINSYILYECPSCRTVMALATSSDLTNSGEYNELFSDGEYEMHREQFEILSRGKLPLEFHRQQLLKSIEKIIVGRNITEIGGGVGAFGVFCSRRGWSYSDYDISSVAVEYAQKLGLQAKVIDDPNYIMLPRTDVIAMWEVIEHIWNVHDYLKIIQESLIPNGLLILSTPNYHRQGYRKSEKWGKISAPPIHVNFFTEESITTTLKSAGFGYVKVISPRFYRPSLSFRSIWYNIQIALGWEPTKTLYVIAGIRQPKNV